MEKDMRQNINGMKRILVMLHMVVICLTIRAAVDSGVAGNGVVWELNGDTLTFSGQGSIGNYGNVITSPWYKYRDDIKVIEIKDGVDRIGHYAFYNLFNLQEINLPNTLLSIGERAFYSCSELEEIRFNAGLKEIEDNAFIFCDKLERVYSPSIEDWCKISFIVLSGDAYANPLAYAKRLYFGGEIVKDKIVIPEGIDMLNGTFCGYKEISEVSLPTSLKSLGDWTFANCSSLMTIDLPSNLTYIGNRCFYYCDGLITLTIPNSVTAFGYGAFEGCSSLIKVNIPNNITELSHDLFSECKAITRIKIPESVTKIGYECFFGCEMIKEIELPESVEEIGVYAFYGCNELREFVIPKKVTTISNRMFGNCTKLVSVTLPEQISKIGAGAFYCCGLESISLPEGLENIEGEAFYGCYNLTSITIPESVKEVGSGAFLGCWALNAVYCKSIESWNNILFLNSYANPLYIAQNLYVDGKILTDLKFDDKMVSVNDIAFQGCTSIVNVEIPNSCISLKKETFLNCSSIQTVKLPESVAVLYDGVFRGCYNIKTVDVKSDTPPVIYDNTFEPYIFPYATLYVNDGCGAEYIEDEVWGQFGKIVEGHSGGEVNKCPKPTIRYEGGYLVFNCGIEKAVYHYTIEGDGVTRGITSEEGIAEIKSEYKLTVYAEAEGYARSDNSTATIIWTTPTLVGGDTGVSSILVESRPIVVSNNDGMVVVSGLSDNEDASIYSIGGELIKVSKAREGVAEFDLTGKKGAVILRNSELSAKLLLE